MGPLHSLDPIIWKGTTPMTHLRRLGGTPWPRVGMVLVAVVLSLAVVAGPAARPAAAWGGGSPSPISVGAAAREIPAGKILSTAGRMSPWGRVATLFLGAGLTYDAITSLGDGAPTDEGDSVTNATHCAWIQGVQLSDGGARGLITVGGSCPGSTGNQVWIQGFCVSPTGAVSRNLVTGPQVKTTPVTATVDCGTSGAVVDTVTLHDENTFVTLMGTFYSGLDASDQTRTTTVDCRKPDGSVSSISDTLIGRPSEVGIPSCVDRLGPGAFPVGVDVTSGPSWDPDRYTDFSADVDPTLFTEYPDCFAGGALSCVVTVWVGSTPCNAGRSVCREWWDLRSDPEANVTCRFGSYVIGMAQCTKFRNAYSNGTQTQTGTNPDGEPVWGNPVVTDPDPTTGPTPGPTPGPTAGPNPEVPPTDPDPETDPDSRSCFGDAWSLNPVDWVYVPVKCAFLWAFKPKVSLQTRVESIVGTITGKAPFSFLTGITGFAPMIPTGTCPDWTVTVGQYERNVVCGHSYTEAIRAARPVLTAFMLALALWPLIRSTMYAAFPILKPNPGVLR